MGYLPVRALKRKPKKTIEALSKKTLKLHN
jgi:hypothetical protein